MIGETDISVGIYIATKLLHGILSAIIGWTISKIICIDYVETFKPLSFTDTLSWMSVTWYSLRLFSLTVAILLIIGIFIAQLYKRHGRG